MITSDPSVTICNVILMILQTFWKLKFYVSKFWRTKNLEKLEFFKVHYSSRRSEQVMKNLYLHLFYGFLWIRTHPSKNSSHISFFEIHFFRKNGIFKTFKKGSIRGVLMKNSYLKVLPTYFSHHEEQF